ncbi:hypothetical protein [Acidianus brierleyi]|uniref:Uncharacterized protein n=1 Tax=Acidianus brierleyi TaxID=41673 RepID=A0A2U9IBA3_9CREN|nr:hypothetical protein [Acidianus brierleyi]AWR93292.1 hypothetical protein DFR85_00380 [Acidianus brierleyi]
MKNTYLNVTTKGAPTAIFTNNTPKQEDKPYKGETKKTRYRGGGSEGPQVDPNQVVPSALQAIA